MSSCTLKSTLKILATCACLLWGAEGRTGSLTATGWPPPNSTIAGYNLYLANGSGGQFTKVNSTPITYTTHTIDGVKAGKTYSFRLTQVDLHGVESRPSLEFSKVAVAETPSKNADKTEDLVKWIKESEALDLSEKTGKPILYDFMALWCGPCKMMARDVFGNPEQAKWINQEFLAVRIQDERREHGMNPPHTSQLQGKYRLQGFPTLIVDLPGKSFSQKWKQSIGYRSPAATRQFLEASLAQLKNPN